MRVIWHLSLVTCHLSPVTYLLSPDTCHFTRHPSPLEEPMALENLQAFSDELAAMVAQLTRSVVRVQARERVAGTGVIWTSEGAIVTADHVVERDENITVVVEGTTYEAELAGRDP